MEAVGKGAFTVYQRSLKPDPFFSEYESFTKNLESLARGSLNYIRI